LVATPISIKDNKNSFPLLSEMGSWRFEEDGGQDLSGSITVDLREFWIDQNTGE